MRAQLLGMFLLGLVIGAPLGVVAFLWWVENVARVPFGLS